MPTIIWRELLCREAGAAREFYATVFGWDFVTERATDFAWGSGPGAYHLVKADTGIHAGIAEIEAPGLFGWISYAWVRDVPRALGELAKAGAAVLRPTFDVPGVGRNAILQTPGAQGSASRRRPTRAHRQRPASRRMSFSPPIRSHRTSSSRKWIGCARPPIPTLRWSRRPLSRAISGSHASACRIRVACPTPHARWEHVFCQGSRRPGAWS